MSNKKIKPDIQKWEFSEDVTETFDNMLARTIPQYKEMRSLVNKLACTYVIPGTDIVDLGCSRGEGIAPLLNKFHDKNRFVGIEVSEPMLNAVKARLQKYIKDGIVDILNMNLEKSYPDVKASVTLSVLTIQFVDVKKRQRILNDVYESTVSGGAFIMVEKVLGKTNDLNDIMTDLYYQLKMENGYTQEEIDRKRLALDGVLIPKTANWNENLLKEAGFNQIDCLWRWMNFAGWIALKD